MWLMTTHGFYSVVQKQPGEFHVRSRVRQDLANLVERVPLPGAQIHNSKTADYAFRIVVGKPEVVAIMQFLAQSLDYPNFKGQIAAIPDQAQKHDLYAQVWQILSDAFGAYGTKGRLSQSSRK